jgi:RNA polymerase sigma-70 factor (ECF subfamily)
VVQRIVRNTDDVDDVVEDAFWQAWRQANRFDPSRGSVQTWLLTIARSRALDRVRADKRRREEQLESDTGETVVQLASDSDPAMDAEHAERRKVVIAALADLPTEQRQTLELGYYAGLSQSEIAERTGQPLGTVKTRMRLGMQKLKDSLRILREDAR